MKKLFGSGKTELTSKVKKEKPIREKKEKPIKEKKIKDWTFQLLARVSCEIAGTLSTAAKNLNGCKRFGSDTGSFLKC